MIKRLCLSWLILGVLCGWAKFEPDPYQLQPIVNAFEFEGVETEVAWADCDQVNAFYLPWAQTVIMCNELRDLPISVTQTILAHELAHGVIYQRAIPFIGSKEVAADELSAYVLHAAGYDRALQEAAAWYFMRNWPEAPRDDHPSDVRRALMMLDLADGTTAHSRRVTWTWNYLLELK